MSNQELLAKIGQSSEETEFYTPMPAGYRKGHHRYVVVVGTVMSGLGKGIFSSSLAKLLQDKCLVVAPIKMEGYLNIDSGTLNPYRHGEVFVLEDGTECDMDLGTYERLRELAVKGDGNKPADVVFVEVGGTVGDYENGFYIEAMRELAFEEGPGSV